MRKSGFRFLLMVDRISAWLLIPLMVVFFGTGFSMVSMYGFQNLIDKGLALYLHTALTPVLLVLFILHAGIRVFFSARKWRKE